MTDQRAEMAPPTAGDRRPIVVLLVDDQAFVSPQAPCLGGVVSDSGALLRRIDISKLLPASVREVLFNPSSEQRWPSPTSKTS